MSYKEKLYKNALEAVKELYELSKYETDIDLYRSIDIINSVKESQIESKEWLVETLLPFIDNPKRICIVGSWYGLISAMLNQHLSDNVEIRNIDSDPESPKIGEVLQKGLISENTKFIHNNAEDYLFDTIKSFDVIINTSCEHMEQDDLNLILALKRKDTIICFQGNNYHDVQSHINTHNSLEEFIKSFNLIDVFYSNEKELENCNRYMVIGR